MSKNIKLDKFYTPKETAQKCIDIFNDTFKNVTEVIEPSAGSGNFSLQIPNCIAYDLEPEHESIIKQDFLKLDLHYKQGRAFIGNPPFGYTNNLARSFYKHACKVSDMIGFILPIGLLNNTDSLYEFDLVKSIDLGKIKYSGYDVHCCFNLYNRPSSGKLNKKHNYKIDWISISRDDEKKYNDYKMFMDVDDEINNLKTKINGYVNKEGNVYGNMRSKYESALTKVSELSKKREKLIKPYNKIKDT